MSFSSRIPPPLGVRVGPQDSAQMRVVVRWRDLLFHGTIALLTLAAVWQITQFRAVQGSWWSVFFDESGPYLLPAIFALLLALSVLMLLEAARGVTWKVAPPCATALVFVAYVWLTVPIAYLNGFDRLKLWKDVAFASSYALAPLIYVLPTRKIMRLASFWLWLSFGASLAALAEAVRRQVFVYREDLTHFLLWTYRVFAGGGGELMYFALGYLVVTRAEGHAAGRALRFLLAYGAVRFFFNYTRLNWVTAGIVLLTFFAAFATRRARLHLSSYLLAGFFVFLVTVSLVSLGTMRGFQPARHPLTERIATLVAAPTEDISVRFRLVEAQLLLARGARFPLSGWGPGGTISPNDPAEPERNDISVFFNGYPGLVYKFGVVGTVLLLGTFGLALVEARRALRAPDLPPALKGVVGGYTMLLLAGLVGSLFTDTIFANMGGIGAALFIGSISAISRRGAATRARRR